MILDVRTHILSLIARGECDAAADVLADQIARAPGDAALRATRALVLAGAGRIEEALEDAGSASDLERDVAYAQWAHALVRIRNGDFRRALPLARRAVALDPAEAKHLLTLAWAEAGEARWRDALVCLDQALAFEPDLLEARTLRALILEQQERARDASPDFRRLLAREPENAFARAGESWVVLDFCGRGTDTDTRQRPFPLRGLIHELARWLRAALPGGVLRWFAQART
jgi:tetratricopeptide (TPR) repeat protein